MDNVDTDLICEIDTKLALSDMQRTDVPLLSVAWDHVLRRSDLYHPLLQVFLGSSAIQWNRQLASVFGVNENPPTPNMPARDSVRDGLDFIVTREGQIAEAVRRILKQDPPKEWKSLLVAPTAQSPNPSDKDVPILLQAPSSSLPDKDFTTLFQELEKLNREDDNINCSEVRSLFLAQESAYQKDSELFPQGGPINNWSEAKVTNWASRLRSQPTGVKEEVHMPERLSVIRRAVCLHTKYEPRPSQIVSVIILTPKGQARLGQILTGEGKSTIVAMMAVVKALQGVKIDITTTSEFLAQRDASSKKSFYELFGLTVGENTSEKTGKKPKECYKQDIVYGTAHTFQVDILLDNYYLLGTLAGRGFEFVIVDEVDSMLIDEHNKSTLLASELPGYKDLNPILIYTWGELNKLAPALDSKENFPAIMLQLALFITNCIEDKVVRLPQHLQEFTKSQALVWASSAILAKCDYLNNHHYIIKDDDIVPVDFENTGEVQLSTHLQGGLHQFLQLKESLPITPIGVTTIYLSNVGFYLKYKANLSGLTGTLGSKSCQDLLKNVYNLDVAFIPPYKPSQFQELPPTVKYSKEEWLEEIVESIIESASMDRGVLVINRTIDSVQKIFKRLIEFYPQDKVRCYDRSDSEQHKEIEHIKPGQVILATNLAGRGTDIKTDENMEKNGGMHVILTFLPGNLRVERQAFGRTAREGKKGTGQIILDYQATLKRFKLRDEDIQELVIFGKVYGDNDFTYKEIEILRNEVERRNLDAAQRRMEDNITKDELFSKFCSFLKEFLSIFKQNPSLRNALEERWGVWQCRMETEGLKISYSDLDRFLNTIRQDIASNKLVENPKYYIMECNSYIDRGDYKKASESIQRALALNSEDPIIFHKSATCDIKGQRLPQALEELQQERERWDQSAVSAATCLMLIEKSSFNEQAANQPVMIMPQDTGSQVRTSQLNLELEEFKQTLNENPGCQVHAHPFQTNINDTAFSQIPSMNEASLIRQIEEIKVNGENLNNLRTPSAPSNNSAQSQNTTVTAVQSKTNQVSGTQAPSGQPEERKLDTTTISNSRSQQTPASRTVQNKINPLNVTSMPTKVLSQVDGRKISQLEKSLQKKMEISVKLRNICDDKIQKIKDGIEKKKELDIVSTPIEDLQIGSKKERDALKANGLDKIDLLKVKQKSWWSVLTVALLGIVQVVIGATLTAVSGGAGTYFGIGLIAEGVWDLVTAGVAALKGGHFEWKKYLVSKVISLASTVAFASLNAYQYTQNFGGPGAWQNLKDSLPKALQGLSSQPFKTITDGMSKALTSSLAIKPLASVPNLGFGAFLGATAVTREVCNQIYNKGDGEALEKKRNEIINQVGTRVKNALMDNGVYETLSKSQQHEREVSDIWGYIQHDVIKELQSIVLKTISEDGSSLKLIALSHYYNKEIMDVYDSTSQCQIHHESSQKCEKAKRELSNCLKVELSKTQGEPRERVTAIKENFKSLFQDVFCFTAHIAQATSLNLVKELEELTLETAFSRKLSEAFERKATQERTELERQVSRVNELTKQIEAREQNYKNQHTACMNEETRLSQERARLSQLPMNEAQISSYNTRVGAHKQKKQNLKNELKVYEGEQENHEAIIKQLKESMIRYDDETKRVPESESEIVKNIVQFLFDRRIIDRETFNFSVNQSVVTIQAALRQYFSSKGLKLPMFEAVTLEVVGQLFQSSAQWREKAKEKISQRLAETIRQLIVEPCLMSFEGKAFKKEAKDVSSRINKVYNEVTKPL